MWVPAYLQVSSLHHHWLLYQSSIYPFNLLRAQCPLFYRENRTACVPPTILYKISSLMAAWQPINPSSWGVWVAEERWGDGKEEQLCLGLMGIWISGQQLCWRKRKRTLPLSVWAPSSPFWKNSFNVSALMVQNKEQSLRARWIWIVT